VSADPAEAPASPVFHPHYHHHACGAAAGGGDENLLAETAAVDAVAAVTEVLLVARGAPVLAVPARTPLVFAQSEKTQQPKE